MHEHHVGRAVFEDIAHFARRAMPVHRDRCSADECCGERDFKQRGVVAHQQRDAALHTHTQLQQTSRDALHTFAQGRGLDATRAHHHHARHTRRVTRHTH
ncbi:hypothetical protein D3C87_1302480 [compost metagenome]